MGDTLRYTTIVRTDDDGSAFADAEIALAERQPATGMAPMLIGSVPSATGVVYLRSAEFDSAPHPAPREQWVVMLRGTIEVGVSDGSRRRFGPGDLLHVTDTIGRGHISAGVGEPPFEALFVPVPAAS